MLSVVVLIAFLAVVWIIETRENVNLEYTHCEKIESKHSRLNPGFGTQLDKYQMYKFPMFDQQWFDRISQEQDNYAKYISHLQERPSVNAVKLFWKPETTL